MTDTEAKALALVNAHAINRRSDLDDAKHTELRCALLDAVQPKAATEARHAAELREQAERFDAFRREVSDAVEAYLAHTRPWPDNSLRRFIIAKPDPLVEVWKEVWAVPHNSSDKLKAFRAAIEARGGKIVWEAGEW